MRSADEILKKHGIRLTRGRRRLFDRLRSIHRVATVQELHEVVGGDIVTIYRNIETFLAAALVREIRLPGKPACYEDAFLTHHHHVVCTECGTIAELPPCSQHESPPSFRVPGFRSISGHSLEYFGTCMSCAR